MYHDPFLKTLLIINLMLKCFLPHTNYYSDQILRDVNGDGRSDIVCTGPEGGISVYEAKDEDNANIYDPNSKWTDDHFGFCALENKMVLLLPI